MSNWISTLRILCFLLVVFHISSQSAFGKPAQIKNGQNSLDQMAQQFLLAHPSMKYLGYPQWGGSDIRDPKTGRAVAGFVNPALVRGASPLGTVFPPTAASAMGWKTESRVVEGMYYSHLSGLGGFNGWENSDLKAFAQNLQAGDVLANTMLYPLNAANHAKAQTTAQFIAAGNALGELSKDQAANAIDYSSKYLQNFTADGNNAWNLIRNNLFVPIGILLLLPGAVLSQVRSMVASGNPVLSDCNPFDGILRSVVAIFLIPASYLIVNYGIDFSNSIVLSMAGEYETLFGSNMYKDAMCAQIRAFPVRTPEENQNVGAAQPWSQPPVSDQQSYEAGLIESKKDDPCGASSGTENGADDGRTDEGMPANAVAARFIAFGSNVGLTLTWDVLCAFQMAYLLYLFFVGPIMAGLWVWPMAQLRSAFPSWVEGVITICFWSLFWNTVILLMACFKGVGETGTLIVAALNFLAVNAVKFAFDFSGLVRAAGMEAAQRATSGAQGSGGSSGAGGAAGAGGARGSAGATSRANAPTTAPTAQASSAATAAQPATQTTTQAATPAATQTAPQFVPGTTLPMFSAASRIGTTWQSPAVTLPPSATSPQVLRPVPQLSWMPVASAPPLSAPTASVASLVAPLLVPAASATALVQGAQAAAHLAAQTPLIAPSRAFIAGSGAPSLAIQTSAGTFYLIPGGAGEAPVLMAPTQLLGAPMNSAIATTFSGVSYSPISLPPGQAKTIPLTNGGILTFNGIPGQWSFNVCAAPGIGAAAGTIGGGAGVGPGFGSVAGSGTVAGSGSGATQSITLTPGQNGSYELNYLNGTTLLGSLVVTPNGSSTAYTAFNASGTEIQQSLYANGTLITGVPQSSNSSHTQSSVAARVTCAQIEAANAGRIAAAVGALAFFRTAHTPSAYQTSAPPFAVSPLPNVSSPSHDLPSSQTIIPPALARIAVAVHTTPPTATPQSVTSPQPVPSPQSATSPQSVTSPQSATSPQSLRIAGAEPLTFSAIEDSPIYARTDYLEFGKVVAQGNESAIANVYRASNVEHQNVKLFSGQTDRASQESVRNGHTVVTFLSKLRTSAELKHVNAVDNFNAPSYERVNFFDPLNEDDSDLAALPLISSRLNSTLRFASCHRPGR